MNGGDQVDDGNVEQDEASRLALANPVLDDVDDDDADALEPVHGDVDVFISYRLFPDATKAAALRTLLRKTIEPVPNVFVSGDGGLVPSNVALKAQLFTAFRQAKAIIAVITPDSKTREWVIYEAGAAWGCEKLYAPILVDVDHEAISSTMVDFVSTKAREQEEVRRLVEQVARRIGGRLKGRFGTSYAPFLRQLTTGGQQAALSPADDDTDILARATVAWSRGEKAEAERLWTEACTKAADEDELVRTRLRRLVTLTDDGEEFERLLMLEASHVQTSPEASLWRGIMADHDHVRVERHRESLSRDDVPSDSRAMARLWLAKALFNTGRDEEATDLLLEAIAGRDTAAARSEAAALLCKQRVDFAPLSRLMLRLSAYKETNRDVVRDLADLALEHGWDALSLFFSAAYDRLDDDGTSKNTLGRAALSALLPSVAFEAFSRAAEKGVSVAKANLAGAHARYAIPAAGLVQLQRHEGPFDSADPAFPHRTRAELEKLVADEQKSARELIAQGRKLVAILLEFSVLGWSQPTASLTENTFVAPTDAKKRLTLRPLAPFRNLFEVRAESAVLGLAVETRERAIAAVIFNPASRDEARRTVLNVAPPVSAVETLLLGT